MHTRLVTPLFAALTLAFSSFLSAEVVVLRKAIPPNSPWLPIFGDGALSVGLTPATAEDAVGELINGRDLVYFAQSIKGDGRILEAVGFYGNGTNPSPSEYSLTLLDYGVTSIIETAEAFSPQIPPVVLFSETFSLIQAAPAQLYFDLRGTSCVTLHKDHAYVILVASSGGGSCSFYRLNGKDSTYAGGTAAKGLVGLNPDSFAGPQALRDAVFSLYTTLPLGAP